MDLVESLALVEVVRLAALRASLDLEVLADLAGAAQAQEALAATGDLATVALVEVAVQGVVAAAVEEILPGGQLAADPSLRRE